MRKVKHFKSFKFQSYSPIKQLILVDEKYIRGVCFYFMLLLSIQ